MNFQFLASKNFWTIGLWSALMAATAIGVAATFPWWWAPLSAQWTAQDETEDDHPSGAEPHQHSHAGHDESSAIHLTPAAQRNIRLKTGPVTLEPFVKTATIPAMIVERPGRSQFQVNARVTGTVTRIYPLEGEVVEPGRPLFEISLSHEDIVEAQRDYLQTIVQLDIAEKELARLESIGDKIILGKRIVDQQYETERLQAVMHAQRQALLLHGLSKEQIDEIARTRQLGQAHTVLVPEIPNGESIAAESHVIHVQKLFVKPGQHIAAGEPLALLADHSRLYVEGKAFEEDGEQVLRALEENLRVAVSPVGEGASGAAQKLPILYVSDRVEQDSRALHFYMELPNRIVRQEVREGRKFVAWRYRPGQRMEVQLPIGETWTDQIVLPAEAVIDEGAEAFVFERNGDHFDRLPVQVLYRDQDRVVVANDGSLLGASVALSGAYQLHLAIKNKAGGGVDPHAGHNH